MGRSRVDRTYAHLIKDLTEIVEAGRAAAAQSVSQAMTLTYFHVGRRISECELEGRRAEYGRELMGRLAQDLSGAGRGFSLRGLYKMTAFYRRYRHRAKILPTRRQNPGAFSLTAAGSSPFPVSWSHYVRLLQIEDREKADFYEEEARRGGWSARELDRQINSGLYERVASSRRKVELLEKAESGPVESGLEALKDPYILEFLDLPEMHSERDLEDGLLAHLEEFLLEMGHGFCFVARQKALHIGDEIFYVDLLLYHRGVRALVVVELKLGKFTPRDVGQLRFYMNYLKEHDRWPGENDPIGLLLCSEKDDSVVRYALDGVDRIKASRYRLKLPKPEEIRRQIEDARRQLEGK